MIEREFDLSANIFDRRDIIPVSKPRAMIDRLLEGNDISFYTRTYLQMFSSPEKIQKFIDTAITYNRTSTKRGFKDIVSRRSAHCFETAYGLAYPAMHLWGYHPRAVYLNSDPELCEEDHAIVVYRMVSGYGSVGTGGDEYGYRPATYPSFDALMKSFYGKFGNYNHLFGLKTYAPVLRGYSDPIELLDENGTTDWFWKEGDDALEYFWYHSTDNVMCTDVTTGNRYMYPPYTGE